MERIEKREGESLELGGYTFAIALARGKRVVMFANSDRLETGETGAEAILRARRFREKLDKAEQKGENTAN